MVEITWLYIRVYKISWCIYEPLEEISFISNIHSMLYMYNVYIQYDI